MLAEIRGHAEGVWTSLHRVSAAKVPIFVESVAATPRTSPPFFSTNRMGRMMMQRLRGQAPAAASERSNEGIYVGTIPSTTDECRSLIPPAAPSSSAIQHLDPQPAENACQVSKDGSSSSRKADTSRGPAAEVLPTVPSETRSREDVQNLSGEVTRSTPAGLEKDLTDMDRGKPTSSKSESSGYTLADGAPSEVTVVVPPKVTVVVPPKVTVVVPPERRDSSAKPRGLDRDHVWTTKRNLQVEIDTPPKGFADILRAAYSKEVVETHQERWSMEQAAKIQTQYWLNSKLMDKAVSDRDGADSWQAIAVRLLQSHRFQIGMIILLLVDIIFIFAELFIEAEYPTCRTMSQVACISTCTCTCACVCACACTCTCACISTCTGTCACTD